MKNEKHIIIYTSNQNDSIIVNYKDFPQFVRGIIFAHNQSNAVWCHHPLTLDKIKHIRVLLNELGYSYDWYGVEL